MQELFSFFFSHVLSVLFFFCAKVCKSALTLPLNLIKEKKKKSFFAMYLLVFEFRES